MTPDAQAVCRMCGDPAVVRVSLPRGCAVYPDDRVQDLCEHHWHKITPLGGAELVRFLAERVSP